MAVLTIAQAQADLARAADKAAEARVRALEEERRAAEERLRVAEERLLQALRPIGEIIRQLDDLIARVPPSDPKWKKLLTEARALRADLYSTMEQSAPEDAWFWTEGWQAGEREAEAQIAAGEGTTFADEDSFLAHLRALRPDVADL